MSALTKAEIVEKICEKSGINRKDGKEFVELFFNEIKQALVSGHEVKLSGFGNFELRDKGERPGRNPKTGEEIPISARRVVTFKAGQKFRSRVGGGSGEQSSSVEMYGEGDADRNYHDA